MNIPRPAKPLPRCLRSIVGLLALLACILSPAVAQPPPLYTAAPSYSSTNRYVATAVFHWFTSTGGQLTGSWVPLEGRRNWTGQTDWWIGQIKQMMMANIDVLYVHLYLDPVLEQERINLFTALSQLRAVGYDTPKIVPFLDPAITWNGQPAVDLATAAGKDTFVAQYIRFYNQYYGATTDPFADDYLARQGNKPILDTYVMNTCVNIPSLTRADVSNRLARAFGAAHPCFTNGFVMVSCVANPTLGFADEKVHQFEILGYYNEFLQNSIRSVQLKGGYWDQNIRNPGGFLPRAGGSNYISAWAKVNRNTTRRVYVESWNEYDEGTGIYAVTNAPPYIEPNSGNNNTDVWSATGDPLEYIRTTARGAATFNDTPAQDARILWHNIPATLTPGEPRIVSVIVRNTGDSSWTAAANYKLGQGDADTAFVIGKRTLMDDTQDEIPFYSGIFRGRTKTFQVALTAPATPGTYTNHWRMLQESVTWFGGELVLPITVKTKSAATLTLTNLAQMADESPKSVSAATTPPGLAVSLTYNGSLYPPSSPGTYTVLGIIDDSNYQGRATNTLVITPNPNLLKNGSFEGNPTGASVTSPPDFVDSRTILGWRLFDVDSASVTLNASIITNASVGLHAIRLDVNNSNGSGSYALDQWDPGMHTRVEAGAGYIIYLDAAWISGVKTNNLLAYINEFDSSGTFIGTSENLGVVSVSDTAYKTFKFAWRPVNPGTTEIGLGFRAMPNAIGTTSVGLDNVQIRVAPLVLNGSFEFQPDGTTVSAPPAVVNSTAITGWRVFDVNADAVSFSATIISNASSGSHAIRLSATNTTGGGGYALDQWDPTMQEPVRNEAEYIFSIDAAWISGARANNLLIYINEFDANGNHNNTSENLGLLSVSNSTYKTFKFAWRAANPGTARIGLGFTLMPGAVGTTTISLDNVAMEIATSVPVNGDFEFSSLGTRVAFTAATIDTSTFPGWRLFSVGAPPIRSFAGTIVNAGIFAGGQPGSRAMRLDIDNTGTPAGFDYALDTDNVRIPVTPATAYTLTFDLELDAVSGGSFALEASIAEYDGNGLFTGTQGNYTPAVPSDKTFHHYQFDYVIQNPNTTQVTIAFRPRNPGFVSAIVLDNVLLAPYVPIANTVTFYRAKGAATQIKTAKIMAGQPLGSTFVTNSPATLGGASLTSDGTTINVPAGSVDDSFNFTLSGLNDATNTGTVIIRVGAPAGLPATPFPNGSFEFDAYGTGVGSGTPFVDTTTFSNWRLFTVGSPAIALFSATIQDASSTDGHSIQGGVPGSHCLRLDVNNPSKPAGADYGFDRNDARIPVAQGVTYTFSFDAALHGLTGGSFTLLAGIPEYNAAGVFTGSQTSFSPALDGAFRTWSYSWTPKNSATRSIAPSFRVLCPGFASALGIDNVMLHAPVAGTITIPRVAGLPVLVAVSDLLTNCTDTENHPLIFAGCATTTTSGATLVNDGAILRIPAGSTNDSFTYQITDGLGATNIGTVLLPTVNVFGQTTASVTAGAGNVTASFTGIPGYSYIVQRATEVSFSTGLTNWPAILTPANGRFQIIDGFTDLGGRPRQAYYRLVWHP